MPKGSSISSATATMAAAAKAPVVASLSLHLSSSAPAAALHAPPPPPASASVSPIAALEPPVETADRSMCGPAGPPCRHPTGCSARHRHGQPAARRHRLGSRSSSTTPTGCTPASSVFEMLDLFDHFLSHLDAHPSLFTAMRVNRVARRVPRQLRPARRHPVPAPDVLRACRRTRPNDALRSCPACITSPQTSALGSPSACPLARRAAPASSSASAAAAAVAAAASAASSPRRRPQRRPTSRRCSPPPTTYSSARAASSTSPASPSAGWAMWSATRGRLRGGGHAAHGALPRDVRRRRGERRGRAPPLLCGPAAARRPLPRQSPSRLGGDPPAAVAATAATAATADAADAAAAAAASPLQAADDADGASSSAAASTCRSRRPLVGRPPTPVHARHSRPAPEPAAARAVGGRVAQHHDDRTTQCRSRGCGAAAASVELYGCTIAACMEPGVKVYRGRLVARSNAIAGSARGASVVANGGRVELRHNEICAANGDGVSSWNDSDLRLEGNCIHGNSARASRSTAAAAPSPSAATPSSTTRTRPSSLRPRRRRRRSTATTSMASSAWCRRPSRRPHRRRLGRRRPPPTRGRLAAVAAAAAATASPAPPRVRPPTAPPPLH